MQGGPVVVAAFDISEWLWTIFLKVALPFARQIIEQARPARIMLDPPMHRFGRCLSSAPAFKVSASTESRGLDPVPAI